MAVRTKQLANGVLTTTLTSLYTVPAGKTAIIRSIHYYNPAGGATTTVFFSALIGGNSRGIVISPGVLVNTTPLFPDFWFVLGPGDSLRGSANPSSAVQFLISGAELEGVAP